MWNENNTERWKTNFESKHFNMKGEGWKKCLCVSMVFIVGIRLAPKLNETLRFAFPFVYRQLEIEITDFLPLQRKYIEEKIKRDRVSDLSKSVFGFSNFLCNFPLYWRARAEEISKKFFCWYFERRISSEKLNSFDVYFIKNLSQTVLIWKSYKIYQKI